MSYNLAEFVEKRPDMFKRLVKGTDLTVTNYENVSYANTFYNDKAVPIIQMKTEKFLFGLFKESTVYMPSKLKIEQEFDSGKYYIGYDSKDLKKIVTYTEGKSHMKELIKQFKKLKNDISAKEFASDFS